METISIVTYPT